MTKDNELWKLWKLESAEMCLNIWSYSDEINIAKIKF